MYLRGVQCGRPRGAMGSAWGVEVLCGAEALRKELHERINAGIADGHESFVGLGAGCVDRVGVRGRPAFGGGR